MYTHVYVAFIALNTCHVMCISIFVINLTNILTYTKMIYTINSIMYNGIYRVCVCMRACAGVCECVYVYINIRIGLETIRDNNGERRQWN